MLHDLLNLSILALLFISTPMSHPLILSQLLVLFSVTVSLKLWALHSMWMSISTAIVFLGGVMIMILYLASLLNNDKINTPPLKINFLILTLFAGWTMSYKVNLSFMEENLNNSILYWEGQVTVMFLLFFFLALGLIAVVKVSQIFKGNMKKH